MAFPYATEKQVQKAIEESEKELKEYVDEHGGGTQTLYPHLVNFSMSDQYGTLTINAVLNTPDAELYYDFDEGEQVQLTEEQIQNIKNALFSTPVYFDFSQYGSFDVSGKSVCAIQYADYNSDEEGFYLGWSVLFAVVSGIDGNEGGYFQITYDEICGQED